MLMLIGKMSSQLAYDDIMSGSLHVLAMIVRQTKKLQAGERRT